MSVNEAFNCAPSDRIPDEKIIPWCARENRVWITADEAARRQHEFALKQHQVSVLWVHRPKTGMSTAYQHAHLAAALLKVDYLLGQNCKGAVHYAIASPLGSQPREIWRGRRARD